MFELSVAFKYLMPKWRQLSVSIISIISILVIALVVWLIVVFFSVTQGLEKNWVQKLIALTAPVRVSPTPEYYKSYYYQADGVSVSSDYTLKTIGEKFDAVVADPYDPDFDEELPLHWSDPDLDSNGNVKDIVKLAYSSIGGIDEIPSLLAEEYELTIANLKLQLHRTGRSSIPLSDDFEADSSQSYISQTMYIGSYDSGNPALSKIIQPVTGEEIGNLAEAVSGKRLEKIFNAIQIERLRTPLQGWKIPRGLLPADCEWVVCAMRIRGQVKGVYIPRNPSDVETYLARGTAENVKALPAILTNSQGQLTLKVEGEDPVVLESSATLIAEGDLPIDVRVNPSSFENAHHYRDVGFTGSLNLQGIQLSGEIPLGNLEIDKFTLSSDKDLDLHLLGSSLPKALPSDHEMGEGVLLPKGYKDNGVLIGDRGYLSYNAPTASSIQEQRVPIFVAGFYDPGILPLGSKIVLANKQITTMIRSAYPNDENPMSNGLNIRFADLDDAELAKAKIEAAFDEAGIGKYWKVETYREYEFTKDLLQQLRSERNLFTLISIVIIIVACSNIVSMLIILVNDKKMEIGILRSMGASSRSIAFIFGLCGIVMGFLGSLLGTVLALVTLQNLQSLIDLISRLQGFELFNPVFFGDVLPHEVSFEVLTAVMMATAFISLIAGIVPAVKACLLRPSAILRSE